MDGPRGEDSVFKSYLQKQEHHPPPQGSRPLPLLEQTMKLRRQKLEEIWKRVK
jgi:hypothetical protein